MCEGILVDEPTKGARADGTLVIVTGFVVPDHYGRTYETYYKLIDVAKRAFPKLEKRDIELLSVTRSGAYEGMPVIRFRVPPVSEVR